MTYTSLKTLRCATPLFCALSLGGASMAATKPLAYPYGLAVDSKGNLYVANANGNDVLVYNASHLQVASKTITNSVSSPAGLAFDASGNLWVANSSPAVINEYTNGVLNENYPITEGLVGPQALAFDGNNDLLVEDDFDAIDVYPPNYTYPAVTISTTGTFTGLAAHQGGLAIGGITVDGQIATETASTTPFVLNKGATAIGIVYESCFAAVFDSAGNLYCGNDDETLSVFELGTGLKILANIGFFPTGIAIDNTRGLVYLSNGPANEIAVYETSGTYVTTIK